MLVMGALQSLNLKCFDDESLSLAKKNSVNRVRCSIFWCIQILVEGLMGRWSVYGLLIILQLLHLLHPGQEIFTTIDVQLHW